MNTSMVPIKTAEDARGIFSLLSAWICFPFLFLWGIGIGLGEHFGIAGIGYGDLLFVYTIPLILILLLNNKIYIYYIFDKLNIYFLSCLFFIVTLTIGNHVGGHYWEATERDFYILARQSYYFFILIPILTLIAMRVSIHKLLHFFLLGVVFASGYNLANYEFGVFGSVAGQNAIGQQVAMIFPYVFYLLFFSRKKIQILIYFLLLFLLLLTSFFSLSKGSWISILISIILFFILFLRRRGMRDLFFVLIVIFFISVIFFKYNELINDIILTEISASEGSGSNEQRFASIISGFMIALIYPFGVGGSHYPEAAAMLDVGLLWIQPDPHNVYAHAASWGGIIGFIFFFIIFFYPLFLIIKNRKILNNDYLFYLPMLGGIYFFANTSGEHLTQPGYWAFSAILFGDIIKKKLLSKY